jgi:hypothetical protein
MALRQEATVHNEADTATIEAIMEAGSAAVGAGAFDAAIRSFGTAAGLADRAGMAPLSISARMSLAEVLIHSLRNFDDPQLLPTRRPRSAGQKLGDSLRDRSRRIRDKSWPWLAPTTSQRQTEAPPLASARRGHIGHGESRHNRARPGCGPWFLENVYRLDEVEARDNTLDKGVDGIQLDYVLPALRALEDPARRPNGRPIRERSVAAGCVRSS